MLIVELPERGGRERVEPDDDVIKMVVVDY